MFYTGLTLTGNKPLLVLNPIVESAVQNEFHKKHQFEWVLAGVAVCSVHCSELFYSLGIICVGGSRPLNINELGHKVVFIE